MDKETSQTIPIFLCHLYQILKDPIYSDILQWQPQRKGFLIKNQNRLTQQILPKYYRHKNFSSFVRQLNMYGFKKLRNKQEHIFFLNQQFDLSKEFEELRFIKRKISSRRLSDNKENVSQIFMNNLPKKVSISSAVNLNKNQIEQQIVKILQNLKLTDNISSKITNLKKNPQYHQYLIDSNFVQKVCKKAGVKKPRQQQCLSELSIEEQIMESDQKSYYFQSMKLVQSGVITFPSGNSISLEQQMFTL